jgi:hypothetical protein
LKRAQAPAANIRKEQEETGVARQVESAIVHAGEVHSLSGLIRDAATRHKSAKKDQPAQARIPPKPAVMTPDSVSEESLV